MNLNKYFRVCIALLVVCCLLVNVSPVRVHASSLVYSSVAVDAWNVISSILIGLGLMAGTTTTEFNQIVDLIISTLDLGGVIDVICWVASGFQKYAVPQSLVEAVRACLFSSSVLTEELERTSFLSSGTQFPSVSYGTVTVNKDCYVFVRPYSVSSYNVILIPFDFVSTSGLISTQLSSSLKAKSTAGYYYLEFGINSTSPGGLSLFVCPTGYSSSGAVRAFLNGEFDFSPETVVATDYDVSLGAVGSSSIPFEESYTGWIGGAVSVPSDDSSEDDKVYLPIGIGQTKEETSTMTQDQVQAGESTYSDSSVDAVTSTWLGNWFNSLVSSLGTWFNNVISSIEAIPGTFTTFFDDVLSGLETLGETILAGIQSIFVPTEDFVTAKLEALRARFDFVNVFIDFIELFKGQFGSTTPPVIYVPLDKAEGSFYFGEAVPFLDMSWYSRYKAHGDAIISGFLWALFGWRMYLKLPGIINGVSGSVGSISSRIGKDGE